MPKADNKQLIDKLVNSLLKGIDRKMTYAFFPIHISTHYCLLILHFPTLRWRFYNPLTGHPATHPHHKLAADRVVACLGKILSTHFKMKGADGWFMSQIRDAPFQRNSADCGIYVMMYAAQLASGVVKPVFDQTAITMLYRPMIAAVLLRGSIEREFDDVAAEGLQDIALAAKRS